MKKLSLFCFMCLFGIGSAYAQQAGKLVKGARGAVAAQTAAKSGASAAVGAAARSAALSSAGIKAAAGAGSAALAPASTNGLLGRISDAVNGAVAVPNMDEMLPKLYKTHAELEENAADGEVTLAKLLEEKEMLAFVRENGDALAANGAAEMIKKAKAKLPVYIGRHADKLLEPLYKEIKEYTGTYLRYPAAGSRVATGYDEILAIYADCAQSKLANKIARIKAMQDYYDKNGVFPEVWEADEFSFLWPAQEVQREFIEQKGRLPYWKIGNEEERNLYRALDYAITFQSVGSPFARLGKLSDKSGATVLVATPEETFFVVPQAMRRMYVQSVFERLADFIGTHHRYPYYGSYFHKDVVDPDTNLLTEEAMLNLAVERALAFGPEVPYAQKLAALKTEGQKMIGTALHDFFM